ncbi:MAG TPA: GNAT family N-acetyltransferase [Feifaniaceae bacterium]|nr:GNAT family N-acetyltransferase [Feifaniaceae bacterium]
MSAIVLPEQLIIETERLKIRPLLGDDAPGFFALRQDAAVTAMMGFSPYTRAEEAEQYVAARMRMMARGDCLFWAVTRKEGGAFIGSACLWNFRLDEGSAEIGYELLPAFQHKGYAGETIRAVCRYAFSELGFARVDAFVDPDNAPSLRVLERNGFSFCGPARHAEGAEELMRYALAG